MLQADVDIKNVTADVMIGHCRAATVGEVTLANCHPFKKDDLVISHNGTILSKIFNKDPTQTDSEQMVEYMAERSVLEGLQELGERDAYAIAGVDTKKGEMYLSRNDKRSLHIAISSVRGVMWWASEKPFLEMILNRNKAGAYKTYQLNTDKLYRFNVSDINATDHKIFYIDDVEYKKKEIEVPEKKSNVIPLTRKEDTEDSENGEYTKCYECGNSLTTSDYSFGEWMGAQKGFKCESCVRKKVNVH